MDIPAMIIFFSLTLTAFALGGYTIFNHYRMLHLGQPEEIRSSFFFKLKSVVVNVLLQKDLFKRPLRGFFHAVIFYGFLVYGVHTTSQLIGGFLGDYYFYIPSLLGLGFEHIYDYVLDIFSLLVLAGLFFFASRRWLLKAPELDRPSAQSFIIIKLIGVLMVSTLMGEAAKSLTLAREDLNPIRGLVVGLYRSYGLADHAELLFKTGWWVHILTVLALSVYVPRSKHAHLIWAPLNYFYARNKPRGAMRFLDVENTELWGAANVNEFSWKGLLDGLSCIECGRCQLECPASRTGKLLSPKKIMVDLKYALMEQMPKVPSAPKEAPKEAQKEAQVANSELRVIDHYTPTEALWACTTCYACVEACPVGNDQVDSILEMRRSLVLNEGSLPTDLQGALTNIENQSNPWGVGSHKREGWAEDMDILTMSKWKEKGEQPDVLFWVGCAGAFDDRNKKIVRSFAGLMKTANVRFGILGNEENCTGDSARRAGNEYLFQTMAQKNINTMNSYGIKKVVTSCPHCFNTIKNEYPQLGGGYEVIHHSEFLDQLLDQGRLKIDSHKAKKSPQAVYHDSCYLGRYNGNYSAPRNILEKATGKKVVEAIDHRSRSLCCGAGGAQMWKEEENGNERVNIKRTDQLLATEAPTIASACPFCMTMIEDGVNAKEKSEDTAALDIAEVLEKSIAG